MPPTRARVEENLDDEWRFHLEARAADLRGLGMSDDEAMAEAQRQFGDLAALRPDFLRAEERRVRRSRLIDLTSDWKQDVRYAIRQLRRQPLMSAVIVFVLASCIGLTTAAYGVVRHLLLAPLPFSDGNRIVSLEARNAGDGEFDFSQVSPELLRLWVARAHTIDEIAAIEFVHKKRLLSPSGAAFHDSLPAVARVSPSFLSLLRVHPIVGRGFDSADARPSAPAVAILTAPVWRARFDGDRSVIGRTIDIDGLPRTIVGVVPAEVTVPTQSRDPLEILLPVDIRALKRIDGAFARLRPDITSAASTRELEAILRTMTDTDSKTLHAVVTTAAEQLDPRRGRAVEVLLIAASALLLIACADIASLLLMRAWARRREFAIRQALGASRGRLVRQLLTESVLLAAPSGALGLLVASLALRAAVVVRPWTLRFLDDVQLDGTTFLWSALAGVTTAILFGLFPAVVATNASVDQDLRTGGPSTSGRASPRAHAALVTGQIALSLIFLASAGVLGQSFLSLVRTPIGYQPDGLLEVSVHAAVPRSGTRVALPDVVARAVRASLAATPGVTDVAIGPLPDTKIGGGPSAIDGASGVHTVDIPTTSNAFVSPDYFRVARIPIVRGRGFDENAATAADEVIINEALARHLWPDGDAVGRRLRLGDDKDPEWLRVVGVAGDVRMPGAVAASFELQMYQPTGASEDPVESLVLRARGDTSVLRPALARAVAQAGVGASLDEIVPSTFVLDYMYGAPRFALALFGTFALLAVFLAALGLFGIVAHAVSRRTREIGIRVALGADPSAIGRMVLAGGLRLAVLGSGVGLLGAYAATRTLSVLEYGMNTPSPMVLAGATMLLVFVALVASYIPARRALTIEPTIALRAE